MRLRGTLTILACVTSLSIAHALEPRTTAGGVRWVTGGVGADERAALTSIEGQYSLKIVLAVRERTAYAADATLTVRSGDGSDVFEGASDGPWTLVDLPPGEYAVEAVSRGQTQMQETTVTGGRSTRLVFYFDGN